MAKLPWYLKEDGKPVIENGKCIQKIKVNWAYRLYAKIRYILNVCVGK
jgi:hypothetical protein